jgi:hypothetical protein
VRRERLVLGDDLIEPGEGIGRGQLHAFHSKFNLATDGAPMATDEIKFNLATDGARMNTDELLFDLYF